MRAIYVHPDTRLGQRVAEEEAKGFRVANAPRPLSGPVRWTGEFLHGSLYAAGPLVDHERSWSADDAYLLELAGDDEVDTVLRGIVHNYDELLDAYVEIGTNEGREYVARAREVWYHRKDVER